MTQPSTLTPIFIRPSQGKRVVTWRVKCSACGSVGERNLKFHAQKLAVLHGEERHDHEVLIHTKN